MSGIDSIHKKLFAWGLKRADPIMDRVYGSRKARLFDPVFGNLLEIGPGTGTNFRYYPEGTRVIAVEPNRYLHPYLQQAADAFALDLELHEAYGEMLPLPAGSVDGVISTNVLCSVDSPSEVVAEIYRVLKPGGRFFFIEHVAAPEDSRLRWIQGQIKPLWRRVFGGCHPDREIGRELENAGFRSLQMDRFLLPVAIVGPHISGFAMK